MAVTRHKPQAIVTFYTEESDLVARATNDPKHKMDDDVIDITTTRSVGDDSPTFTITLTRRKMWHKWVAPNDLVKIEMHRPPEAKGTVFLGLVDDVRKGISMSGDGVVRTVTITGRGVAKSFIQFDVGMVPEADYVPGTLGWLLAAGVTVSANDASTVIQAIWDEIAKKFVNYKFSNGRELFDVISYNLTDRENMRILDDSNVSQWQGSLWGLMKEIAEEPFYEMFWEISEKTNLPELMMRPTPFSSKEWNNLSVQQISDDDVVIEDIGRSDIETYTVFSVGGKTLFSANDPYKTFGTRPFWYEPYAKKYGIRRLHVETSYMSTAEAPGDDIVGVMRSLMEDLFNWNIRNNSMFNGTLVVKGSAKYRIGERLIYISDEDESIREYYISGVSHNFKNFGNYTTTLTVTRGCHPDDRFASPVGKHAEYSGVGWVEFNPDAAVALINSGLASDSGLFFGEDGGMSTGDALAVVNGARTILNNGINGVKVRYVFGGNSPSTGKLDCSSFTQYVYKTYANIDLGRTTGQQVTKGVQVDKANLQPGDLVFFKGTYASSHIYGVSHVGIYVGGGKMIHNGGVGVNEASLDSSYYKKHWLMGRRVLTGGASGGSGGTGAGLDGNLRPGSNYSILNNSGITAQQLNAKLGGKLAGLGQVFVQEANKNGIDPAMLAAISMHETGNGTSKAIKNKNNAFGIMTSSGLRTFSSVPDCIRYSAGLLGGKTYAKGGIDTVEEISRKYAPIGADNDPKGLNKNWQSGVYRYLNGFGATSGKK